MAISARQGDVGALAEHGGIDDRARPAVQPADSRDPELVTQWARVRGRLQTEVGEVEYRAWLRQMTLGALDGDELALHLPSRFLRDWVLLGFMIYAFSFAILMQARSFVIPDDIKAVALPALRHRIALAPDAILEGRGADELLGTIIDSVAAPRM